MAARIVSTTRAVRGHLRRLAAVFAVELRLKIVVELYIREMSATQFFNEFGGGSPSRVAKNFKRLAKDDWLRYVRSAPGPSGKMEDFYRATEPAFFDGESWALLPYSLRVAVSWNMVNEVAPRLRAAMEAPRMGRHRDLSCTRLVLDEVGWERVIAAIDALFVSLFEHQDDARRRAAHSGEELIRADVFLIGFEVPMLVGAAGNGPDLVTLDREPMGSFHERLAIVIADEICLRIIEELNMRPMSAARFYRAFGHELENATYQRVLRRFKRLRAGGWLARVDPPVHERSTEHFYRATIPAIHRGFLQPGPSAATSDPDSRRAFEQVCSDAKEAMRAGTFDARTDRYVTCSFLAFDRRAWREVIRELDELADYIDEEQRRAAKRLEESGERPIAMDVVMAAYESPKEAPKAP
jgi:hypothetical protein